MDTHDSYAAELMTRTAASTGGPQVLVIHETDGRKYLEALDLLARAGKLGSVSFQGSSVLWRLAHALLRDRMSPRRALGVALANLRFRLGLRAVRGKTIIICVAPWDFRLPILISMLRGNRIVYNTSWPWWTDGRVPRRYGFATPLFQAAFCAALRRPEVSVVTVTRAAAESITQLLPGIAPVVIPHVVSEVFFGRRARYDQPFKLLFVGELSEKKGLRSFLTIGERLGARVQIEIAGDGPLRGLVEDAVRRPGWRWHGKVADRTRLAEIVAGCQVFLSLSQRTPSWEELFGMAIVEAMAAGLPCIVSDHVGPRGIIRQGQDGFLVAEGDLTAAQAHIEHLIEHHNRWHAMADAAVLTARQFSIDTVSRAWDGLLTGSAVTHPRVMTQTPRAALAQPMGAK